MLDCAGKVLDLTSPCVMGILNVTPDSFSDGGRFLARERAVTQAHRMVEAGAAIIDVGGESTRPGAKAVSVDEELERTIPVIEELAKTLSVPISVDSSKPEVMMAAVAAGAGMINDVYALRRDGALAAAAACGVPVCLMHMQGVPHTMQKAPEYVDVLSEVMSFLTGRIAMCESYGIPRTKIIIDPGFGFGKSQQHNLRLFNSLPNMLQLQLPVMVGVSRKSMIGAVLDKIAEQRMIGSVALATLAAWMGVNILRVHDVAETVDAIRMCQAVKQSE